MKNNKWLIKKDITWKVFEIGKIFTSLIRGNNKGLEVIGKGDGQSYIGAKYNNNGVTGFVDRQASNVKRFNGNAIVFVMTGEGSVGKALYKSEIFIPSNNVYVGYSNHLNKYNAHMIVTIINKQEDKYNYGYIRNDIRLKRERILFPVNSKNEPDYEYMESYIKSLVVQKEQEYLEYISKRIKLLKDIKEPIALKDKEWSTFTLGDLFLLVQGKSKGLNHLIRTSYDGINYLGATNQNNGVLAYIEDVPKLKQKGNCICFIRNGEGSMGYSIYKKEDFIATSDISVGYAEFLNPYIGFFITTIADKVRGKYNFGYKRSDARLKKEKLLLPINTQRKIDYEYMEQYMKYLEYQKLSAYLEFKK